MRTILHEILGLFVDNVAFAVTILAWLVIVRLLLPVFDLPPAWQGPILFAGLAVILAESATRHSRSKS
jgi:uncharacterized membrane protein (DUF4010 family)